MEEWSQEKIPETWQVDCAWIKSRLKEISEMQKPASAGASGLLKLSESRDWAEARRTGITSEGWVAVEALAGAATTGMDERPAEFPRLERESFLCAMFKLAYIAGRVSAKEDEAQEPMPHRD